MVITMASFEVTPEKIDDIIVYERPTRDQVGIVFLEPTVPPGFRFWSRLRSGLIRQSSNASLLHNTGQSSF